MAVWNRQAPTPSRNWDGTLEQYAASLRRLQDRDMLEVEVMEAGGGIGFARPRRVTDVGWIRVDVIREQSDPKQP